MADVRMDYEVVENMAAVFRTAGDTLQAINKVLEAAIMTLRATAFIGLVGGYAVERYLSNIQPRVERLAETCSELNLDLLGAVTSLRDGDTEGSQRFV